MSSLCQCVEDKWKKTLFYKMKVLNQLFTIIIIYLFIFILIILIRAINISQTDVWKQILLWTQQRRIVLS